jgi:kinetochore protein Spc7/SPC105
MDFTRDLQASVNENATRKSLGRRVSFASHAQVRVFEKDPNRGDMSPSAVVVNHPGHPTQPGALVNDENDYPGVSSLVRRRSSLRRSVAFSENGEAPMDMDSELESSPLPAGFLVQRSSLQDEEPDDVSGSWEEEDMELTTNLAARRSRKSSLGLSSLTPSGQVPDLDDHLSSEDMTQESTGDTSGEQTEPTEFTVPLSKSLRKPEPPSAEWLALCAMTHAGADGPSEPVPFDMGEDGSFAHGGGVGLGEDDMDITEAETRLRRMRESLGLTNIAQESSFTSSEGSSIGGDDNQTVNLTSVWRENLGTDSSSVMDLTNVQGISGESSADEAVNRALTPAFSLEDPARPPDQHDPHAQTLSSAPTSTTPFPTVTGLPSDATASLSVFTKPGPVFSAPRQAPHSPSKLKPPGSPRKGGSAAFALPVARPQPKKRVVPAGVDNEDPFPFESQGSPAKTQESRPSPSKTTSTSVLAESISKSSATRRHSAAGLRRPSGYFAQRKSLGPSGVLNIPPPTSPKKKVAKARASIADVSVLNQDLLFGRQNAEPSRSQRQPHFPLQDTLEATGVTDPSNSPLSMPFPADPSLVPSAGPETPAPQITVASAEVGATEQWRNNVQPPSFTEEDEGVGAHLTMTCEVILKFMLHSLPYPSSNFLT